MVLEATEVDDPAADPHVLSTHLHADGHYAKELWLQAPSQAYDGPRISHDVLDRGEHFAVMNGRSVFVHAVKLMPETMLEALNANGLGPDDVDLFAFHQANLRINEQVARHLGIAGDRVYNTIQRFGNTTAATIPLGLDEAVKEGRLEPGMLVGSAAFGGGYTWGSMLIRW